MVALLCVAGGVFGPHRRAPRRRRHPGDAVAAAQHDEVAGHHGACVRVLGPIAEPLAAGAAATGAAGFASFLIGYADSAATGRTMAFVALVVAQLTYVFAVRGDGPFWSAGRNPQLLLALAACAGVLAATLAVPPVGRALGMVDIGARRLAVAVVLALAPVAVGELLKARRRRSRPGAT